MKTKSSSRISEELDEVQELSQADLDTARFRINLQDAPRKQRVNIMLDTAIIACFKARAGSRGYQTLINETLKQAIRQEDLESVIRRVIRDELKHAA
jgi:uncharacterized protein (DUF4415 family)